VEVFAQIYDYLLSKAHKNPTNHKKVEVFAQIYDYFALKSSPNIEKFYKSDVMFTLEATRLRRCTLSWSIALI
jgi:hypothetical protein